MKLSQLVRVFLILAAYLEHCVMTFLVHSEEKMENGNWLFIQRQK